MTDIPETPFNLTGGNSDGGWITGNGFPNPNVGNVGQRYVDVQTGNIYGPKTQDGWPADAAYTLNLGNESDRFANTLYRIFALEGRVTNAECRISILEKCAEDVAQHSITLTEHKFRIEILEADSEDLKRRIGMVDTTLSARMLLAEEILNELSRLRGLDLADFDSRLTVIKSELNDNSSEIAHLRKTYVGFTETWAQDVLTLRSEFEGNLALAQETLRTYANRFTAIAEKISELYAQVGDVRSSIVSESLTRANQYSALAQQLTTLSAEMGNSIANITSKLTAIVDDFQAYASSVEHLSAELGDVRADIIEQVEVMATANSAVARRVSTIDVAIATLSGRIQQEESARINGDTVVLTSTKSMVASSEAGVIAKVTEETGARIAGDQAEAYQRGLLAATIANQEQSLSAAITAESAARVAGDRAEATKREELNTKFTSQGQSLLAAITAESSARSSAISAEATTRNTQISNLNTKINDVNTNLSAAITKEANTRTSAIASETSTRNTQISNLNTKINNVNTTLSAAITSEASTRTSAIQAETNSRNQQITSLNTSLGSALTAAITSEATTRASVDGYLGARTTLTTQVSGTGGLAVAGMEISATASADRQAFSHFAVFADRFFITHSQQNIATAPFRVEGGKVYIETAVIKDASIDTLRIADNAVTVSGGATGIYSAYVTMSTNVWTAFMLVGTFIQGSGKDGHVWKLKANGVAQAGAMPIQDTTGALSCLVYVGVGSHTFSIECATHTGDGGCGLTVIGVKR